MKNINIVPVESKTLNPVLNEAPRRRAARYLKTTLTVYFCSKLYNLFPNLDLGRIPLYSFHCQPPHRIDI